MDDVAARAGVSRALVSLALQGSSKVAPASRAAIERAVEELGYRPNRIASGLASRRTRTFGLVVSDLHNPFFSAVIDAAYQRAAELGYRLLLSSAFLDERQEQAALDTMVEFRVDGVMLAGPTVPDEAIDRVARSVPTVVVSRPITSQFADAVHNDDLLGMRLITEHLIDRGHRHIAHVDGGAGAGAAERRAGYRAAMEAARLRPRVERAGFTDYDGALATRRLLDVAEPVTAICASNDLAALGVLHVLSEAGRAVPGDVAVTGYDDSKVAALHHVSLTTVDQGRHQLGELAVECLAERIDGDRRTTVRRIIEPVVVIRSTT